MQRFSGLICGVVLLLGCQSQPHKATVAENAATAFVSAYNAHDIDLMLSMVHPDMRYMFINKEKIYTETNNKDVLATYLIDFFKQKSNARSRVISSQQHGPFIQQVEQAIITNEQGEVRTQCSLSIYQMADELIINVWYFDVFACSKP